MKDEALKLALEAIEELRYSSSTFKSDKLSAEAITAIKEALAQPVLCKYGNEVQGCTSSPMNCQCCFDSLDDLDEEPAQREWVGLTDEEIKDIIGPWGDTPITGYTRKLFDQIEAKLKEKNT